MNSTSDNKGGEGASTKWSTDLRSFGRKRGRTLSPHQSALLDHELPKVRLNLEKPSADQLTGLFEAPISSLWLEIGFGAAEHLIWQARENPRSGIIGCEPYIDGVVKAVAAIKKHSLQNVRLYDDDVREVLRWLEPGILDRVFILFPDPWPKLRHHKRRLVNHQLFVLLARVMRPGAQLIVATDIDDYARTILIAAQKAKREFIWLAESLDDCRNRPGTWPKTRYELKAAREGRTPYFFTFQRLDNPTTGL